METIYTALDAFNSFIMSALTIGFAIAFYFVPGIVASLREHHNKGAIWLTNFLFGWTGLGWIICLIWSTTSNTKK